MKLFRRKSSQGRQMAAATAESVESDDLSLMSEDSDWEAERAALHKSLSARAEPSAAVLAAAGAGDASLWAEVDRDELERIALNIARNAVPPAASDEGAEAAARLTISAAVAEQAEAHDSTDPLGFGRIDTRLLTLDMRGGGAPKPRYAARLSALEAGGRRAGMGARRGSIEEGAGEAPAALRAKVLPGSRQFDAEAYLGTIHADTALPELLRGLAALRQQLSEHAGQVKALVKENFDRFISSKNTVDTVYAALQRAEAEGEAGVHGASSAEVLEAVLKVQDEARRAFGPLLERHAKADRIRLVLGVMQRYEAVVQLPSRVRQHAEAGDYEQVVADYRKAKALLADQGVPGGGGLGSAASGATPPAAGAAAGAAGAAAQRRGEGGMWGKLMDEIDKVVGSVAHTLETVVRSVQSAPGEAHDAIRWVLQLREVGVPAAQGMDPVGLYVESQERHVRALLEAALAQYGAALDRLRRAAQLSEEAEAQAAALAGLGLGGPGASPASKYSAGSAAASSAASRPSSAGTTPRGGPGDALAAGMQQAAVRYVSLITTALCHWLPEYWVLTQQRLPALAGIGDAAAAVERGTSAAERSVGAMLALYRSAVQTVLGNPSAGGLTHTGLLSLAEVLADGCQALAQAAPGGGAAGAPPPPPHPGALACLRQLTERACHASLAQLGSHLSAAVAELCAAEDYSLTAASRRAGQPSTASVAALQALVQGGMLHLRAVLAQAARAGVAPQAKAAASASSAFFGCFSAYATGVGARADELLLLGGAAAAQVHAGGSGGHQPSLAAEAAAAALGSAAGGGKEAAAFSPSRRLLVLCANLGAARGRLLPQQFSRWSGLLQAGGSTSKELVAAAAACGKQLEEVETRLAGAYIDRKQAALDEVMEQLLFADGTVWEAAPPPQGLRPSALELVHALAAVQAELAATAPALVLEVLEELLLGTLDGFAQVLAQGSPPASAGGVLQLWLEGAVLLGAVGGLGGEPLQQAGGRLRAALDSRLEAAVAAASGEEAAQLAVWSGSAGRPSLEACRQRLGTLCEQAQAAARLNLAPLHRLARQP